MNRRYQTPLRVLLTSCFLVLLPVSSSYGSDQIQMMGACGGLNQEPCLMVGMDDLCYNVYREGTMVDYYACGVETNYCAEGLVYSDGLCKSIVPGDRGIDCCTPILESTRPIGYSATIDLTKAVAVVPDFNVDYCQWNVLGRTNAVRRMSGWMADAKYASLLAINTNFFDAQQTVPNPHLYMCTNAYGPVIRNDSYIAGLGEQKINGTTAWSLVFYSDDHAHLLGYPADIFESSGLPSRRYTGIIKTAVTGVLLATKAAGYNTELNSSTFKPNDTVPRTAVGISRDKKKLYIAVFQDGNKNGGKTLPDLAQYMLANTPSDIVINFDGGGSTTLFYNPDRQSHAFMTEPSDLLPGLSSVTGDKYYRPFPVFLGFR